MVTGFTPLRLTIPCGGRVRTAIKQNKKQGKSTDFWSLKLPKETRHYVPKLLAMADLVKHHGYRYDIPLHSIKAQPVLEEITISRRVKLGTVAAYSGLTSKELYHYNPGYTAGYTRKNKDKQNFDADEEQDPVLRAQKCPYLCQAIL